MKEYVSFHADPNGLRNENVSIEIKIQKSVCSDDNATCLSV